MGADSEDSTYKSCFARSVAKQHKSMDSGQVLVQTETKFKSHPVYEGFKRTPTIVRPLPAMEPSSEAVVRLRKNSHAGSIIEDTRRFSCSSTASSRRTSICSSRIAEVPIENIVQHSKIETLQWQLKEIEKSREMYKAVMKQVVTFLERAHRSLELLGEVNSKQTVSRSKSEHQIAIEAAALNCNQDYTAFRDFTWRRPKKQEVSSEEIPPEKLSREAFRLLRTAQSLLSTQEPNLVTSETDDLEFLAQLAMEFPQAAEVKPPQRTTSFSLSPKLILPENETKISTAFNRKLSLQLNETRKCNYKDMFKTQHQESSRRSLVVETDFLSSTVNELIKDSTRASFASNNDHSSKAKFAEKSSSPPGGSISSVEDESGFSSMNSFQDVGLPLVNVHEDVTAKNALLRSMIHNNTDNLLNGHLGGDHTSVLRNNREVCPEDVKLWQKSENAGHKRWSSTPVESTKAQPAVKVLWV